MFLRVIVILLGVYTLHLLFYCFYSYVVVIFEQPLAQEFPPGLINFLSYLTYIYCTFILLYWHSIRFPDAYFVFSECAG